eukprot:scaffold7330_cov146-Cylindrotheca_fusiformis.AAC.15
MLRKSLLFYSSIFGLSTSSSPPHMVLDHRNDEVLAARAILKHHNLDVDALLTLPAECYASYQQDPNRTTLEERLNLYLSETNNSTVDGIATNATDFNATNSTTPYTLEDVVNETQAELMTYMENCQREFAPEVTQYLASEGNFSSSASSGLSFNWNRCWNDDIDDKWGSETFVFFPSKKLIAASRPDSQAQTYLDEWERDQNEIYERYLAENSNATEEEKDTLFEQAAKEATGGGVCHDNVEGTSWFFFTVMTTVGMCYHSVYCAVFYCAQECHRFTTGYGNQAPVTDDGRLLIYIAGTFSLILFAAVLGSTGYIILAIFDDLVNRFWLSRCLKHSIVGVVLWGTIWLCWSVLISTDSDNWWRARLPDFDVDRSDSMWFAFISTSTIGLGDYFLQPEVIFAVDALKFSVEFLIGFVFLSTFLNKIGEFLFSLLPKRSNSLEARLHATNLILWTHWPCDMDATAAYNDGVVEEEKVDHRCRVEALKELLGKHDPAPDMTAYQNGNEEDSIPSLLDEEEALLRALLASVEAERNELEPTSTPTSDDQTAVLDNSNNNVGSDKEAEKAEPIQNESRTMESPPKMDMDIDHSAGSEEAAEKGESAQNEPNNMELPHKMETGDGKTDVVTTSLMTGAVPMADDDPDMIFEDGSATYST